MPVTRNIGDVARPDLPRPGCRVKLVCGAPAAGKSSYVAKHKGPDDIVIDLDGIACERGLDRERAASETGALLDERNRRLALLAHEPSHRLAWVVVCAPSNRLRSWWCLTLGVRPDDMILLKPTRGELIERILRDPTRRFVRAEHMALVDVWLRRERINDPGILKGGVTSDGFPLDPLHPWNR